MRGHQIRIEVRELRGRQARILIEAPEDVHIDREEVYLRKRDENAAVACPGAADLAALEALVTSTGRHNRKTGEPVEEPVTPAVVVCREGIRSPKSLRKAEEILPAPSA